LSLVNNACSKKIDASGLDCTFGAGAVPSLL
jgi:hypothetical protein